jgi:hypothetical protein
VKPGWRLAKINGKMVYPPFGAVMQELQKMKEKQPVVVEVRNPEALGRMKAYVETAYE